MKIGLQIALMKIQNLILLENALARNNLYEYNKQKGKYTLKMIICKN